jgi:outer membrane protein OmpA-like peptidoglycan-associated protein
MSRTLLTGCMLLAAAPALADCPIGAFRETLRGGRIDQVAAAASDARNAPSCSAAERLWVGRIAALAHAFAARRMLEGGDPRGALDLADSGLRFGRPWQALTVRGDALQRLRGLDGAADWLAASLAYQEALNDIADTAEAENPVPLTEIERLHKLAQQTALLAPGLVEPPRTRSGMRGGLALRAVRGFTVTAVAQPIHFEFGSDRFTTLGAAAVERLAAMLEEEGRPPIMLIGHTDPVGGDDVNDRLSLARAAAVGRHLVQRGYDAGRIRIEGRGRRDPLRIEGGVTYQRDELHQILRRVELVRP